MRPAVRRKTACVLAVAWASAFVAPAFAKPPPPAPFTPPPPPSGTLTICNLSGTRPVSGSFPFTLAAVASAGGTQAVTIPVGGCTGQIFYPQGVSVTVTASVPPGDAVQSIALSGTTTTSVASSSPAGATATVTVGSGQATLTFTTNAPPPHCVVPSLAGLTLTAATTSLHKHSCRVGTLHRVYSKTVRAGRVISASPRRGTTLAPNAAVALVLSRGRRA